MGRKKLPETERRTYWLKIRLNQKEYEMLQKLCELHDKTHSKYIRDLIDQKYSLYEEVTACLKEAIELCCVKDIDRYFYIYDQMGIGFSEEEKNELREAIERRN